MSTLHPLRFALPKYHSTNAKPMASAVFLTMDPTFGPHLPSLAPSSCSHATAATPRKTASIGRPNQVRVPTGPKPSVTYPGTCLSEHALTGSGGPGERDQQSGQRLGRRFQQRDLEREERDKTCKVSWTSTAPSFIPSRLDLVMPLDPDETWEERMGLTFPTLPHFNPTHPKVLTPPPPSPQKRKKEQKKVSLVAMGK